MTLTPKIFSGLHNHLDRLGMRALHHHDVRRPGFCHYFGLKPTAVHGFQVGDDGDLGEFSTQGANAVHSFGDDEGSARLQPVDAGTHGEVRGFESFGDGGDVKRNLHNGFIWSDYCLCELPSVSQAKMDVSGCSGC